MAVLLLLNVNIKRWSRLVCMTAAELLQQNVDSADLAAGTPKSEVCGRGDGGWDAAGVAWCGADLSARGGDVHAVCTQAARRVARDGMETA